MDDDPGRDPGRPPSRRPARVARFDAVPDDVAPSPDAAVAQADGRRLLGRDPDEERVAGTDGVVPDGADGAGTDDAEGARRPPTKVAAFDALGATPAASAQVVDFADLVARREGRRHSRTDGGHGRTDAGHGGVEAAESSADTAEPRRRTRPRATASPPDVGRKAPDVGRKTSDVGREAPDASSDGPSDLPPDLPPDGPLPRGRRRGARVGRLGPDAPDPDRPGPERPEAAADPVAIAREICLRLLTDRARTRQELAQALERKGVPAEAAAAVLDRFDEVGLIDDAAFAGQWVRSRHTYRGLGRRAIAVELRRKGVADDVAGEALAEVDAEAESRRARELVDRKLRSSAVGTAEQRAMAARRLVGMLARKGYGAGVAYRVVREALAEWGAEAEELGADGDLDD